MVRGLHGHLGPSAHHLAVEVLRLGVGHVPDPRPPMEGLGVMDPQLTPWIATWMFLADILFRHYQMR